VLFLVDCQASMLEGNRHNEQQVSNVEQILRAFQSFMKNKVISNENDKLGLVFYNCSQSQNTLSSKGVAVLLALETPDAEQIKEVERVYQLILQGQIKHLADKQGKPVRANLSEALQIVLAEFRKVQKDAFNQKVYLFTNQQEPDSDKEREAVKHKAKDLENQGVDIELFAMSDPKVDNPTFDIAKFFGEIVTYDEDEAKEGLVGLHGTEMRIGELMKRIRQKEHRKRIQGKCLFAISPETSIGLKFYTTVI